MQAVLLLVNLCSIIQTQLLGYEVDTLNSVQFSNNTGTRTHTHTGAHTHHTHTTHTHTLS